jgi:hypothetical protein
MAETSPDIEDRRKFLAICGKFAVVTPPSITVLLSTSLASDAIAASGARSDDGRSHHGGLFDDDDGRSHRGLFEGRSKDGGGGGGGGPGGDRSDGGRSKGARFEGGKSEGGGRGGSDSGGSDHEDDDHKDHGRRVSSNGNNDS